MIETITVLFWSRADCSDWADKISHQIRAARQSTVMPGKLSVQPLPPPHKSGVSTSSLSPGLSRSPRSGLASRGQGPGVQGWKMNCIRPAPPTRSFFQADKRNTLRRKEVEQSSYEEDLQILRVIEAYCFSKQRHTITNSAMLDSTSTPLLSMVDDSELEMTTCSVGSTRSTATTGSVGRFEKLEREVLSLHRKLEKESQMRKQLA